jgi:hypothetical protein
MEYRPVKCNVVVTFDLKGAMPYHYREFDLQLERIGLKKYLIEKNPVLKYISCPANTYVCQAEEDRFESLEGAKNWFEEEIDKLFRCNIMDGTFLVMVVTDCQLAIREVSFRSQVLARH